MQLAQTIADLNPLMSVAHLVSQAREGTNAYGKKMSGMDIASKAADLVPFGAAANAGRKGLLMLGKGVGRLAGGGKYAFGLKNVVPKFADDNVVPKFADDIGAIHLMKDPNWKNSFMNAINNPNNKLHFNLNGIDSKPMQMIMSPGRSGINWEMNALYQNSAAFERTIFHYGGNTYKGFDVFKITP